MPRRFYRTISWTRLSVTTRGKKAVARPTRGYPSIQSNGQADRLGQARISDLKPPASPLARSCIRIGCAGWSIPKQHGDRFPSDGSHLERYGSRLNSVEINSSFYKPHQPSTYK